MTLLENYGLCRVTVGLGWWRIGIKVAPFLQSLIHSCHLHLLGIKVSLKAFLFLFILVDLLAHACPFIFSWIFGVLVMGEGRELQVCHGEKLELD